MIKKKKTTNKTWSFFRVCVSVLPVKEENRRNSIFFNGKTTEDQGMENGDGKRNKEKRKDEK